MQSMAKPCNALFTTKRQFHRFFLTQMRRIEFEKKIAEFRGQNVCVRQHFAPPVQQGDGKEKG
jgi:hypothetical protein